MGKTAYTYAKESIEWYEKNSINNPKNKTGIVFQNQYEEWEKVFSHMALHIKLDTILERLPYDIPNKEKDE